MSLRFLTVYGTEYVEITEEDVEYITEHTIESATYIRMHLKDGREVIPLANVDVDFNEIDGEEKRAFLRSKLRSI